MEDSDVQLLLLTHRGDAAAARELWRRYATRLTSYARAIVGESAASDVVQSVFVGVLRMSVIEIRSVRDVAAYLVGALRRTAISHERERLRRGTRERGPLALARQRVRDLQRDSRRSDRNSERLIALEIHDAIDQLPRRLREVIVLKHHAGLTFDQMALALETNRHTLASRYQDALRQLRERWPLESTAHSNHSSPRSDAPSNRTSVGGVR